MRSRGTEVVSRREALAALLGGGAGALFGRPQSAQAATADTAANETVTGEWTFANRTRVAEGQRLSFGAGNRDGAKVNAKGIGLGLELDNSLVLRRDETETAAPEIMLKGKNGAWLTGAIDVAAAIAARDVVLAAKMDYPNPGNVNDFLYCSHNGAKDPTLGIGKPQPGSAYRTWIVGWTRTEDRGMGTLRLQAGAYQTGKVLACTDWGGVDRVWIDPADWALVIQGERLTRADLAAIKALIARQQTSSDTEPPPPPPPVKGSRSKSALRNLLAKLDKLGIVSDQTRP